MNFKCKTLQEQFFLLFLTFLLKTTMSRLELMRIVFEPRPSKLKVVCGKLKMSVTRMIQFILSHHGVDVNLVFFFSLYWQSITSLILVSSVKKAKPKHCHTDGATLHLTLWRTFQDPQHFILNTMACCTVGVLFQSFYIYPFLLSQEQIFLKTPATFLRPACGITFHLCLCLPL